MKLSKWWKVDLQISTPAWGFDIPKEWELDPSKPEHRLPLAKKFIEAVKAKGLDAVALTAHNSHEWIDEIKAAGQEQGVVVFPGCEITTGSGTSGIHILIIADPSKTSRDIDQLLTGIVGFDLNHPRFGNKGQPLPAPKSAIDILNHLPEGYIAIGPHAFNDDGVIDDTRGDIRKQIFEHPRLMGLDVGDFHSDTSGESFKAKFLRRDHSLHHDFPRVRDIAFVSTSDAYNIADLGKRFSWIRMSEPTAEGLRQALLDHEARLIDCLDPRLSRYQDSNPNRVSHGWIQFVDVSGNVGNSLRPIHVDFHPSFNVLIGSRGSGKSTVVSALRQLYSSVQTLPDGVRQETEQFVEKVLQGATIKGQHCLAISQETQSTTWTTQNASTETKTTSFPVRVINQKELFARVAPDKSDPHAASRSFLAFVDEGLGLLPTTPITPGSWWALVNESRSGWMASIDAYDRTQTEVAQLDKISTRIKEIESQTAALDNPEIKKKRAEYRAWREEVSSLRDCYHSIGTHLAGVSEKLASYVQPTIPKADGHDKFFGTEVLVLDKYAIEVQAKLKKIEESITAMLSEHQTATEAFSASEANKRFLAAEGVIKEFVEGLKKSGITDPNALQKLQSELEQQQKLKTNLEEVAKTLDSKRADVQKAWDGLESLYLKRRSTREKLFEEVSTKSGRLRFRTLPWKDFQGWTKNLRQLLNLRIDAFMDDVPTLGKWLGGSEDADERQRNIRLWRDSLVANDYAEIGRRVQLRSQFVQRLQATDRTIRLRLAQELPDDVVQIEFLRDEQNPSQAASWQDITRGSPGQRTAAMLGFVLHHGDEPLVLDQPEDDLDMELISSLVVKELRSSRWKRQLIIVTHNANIPVLGDAEHIVVMENKDGSIAVRTSEQRVASGGRVEKLEHVGPIESVLVRKDVQNILEGGVLAFVKREQRYNNELRKP